MTSKSQVRRGDAGLLRSAVMAIAVAVMACGSNGESKVDSGNPGTDVGQPMADAAADLGQPTPDTAPADAGADGGCPGIVNYPNPGCGASAAPVCSTEQVMDACAALIQYCGCDGKTTVTGGCGWSSQPYLYLGSCRLDGGTADAM